MSIKQQFEEYRLKVREKTNYPDVPLWMKELLLENLDALLATEDEQLFENQARYFGRGATRALADHGPLCDDMLADIPRVRSEQE